MINTAESTSLDYTGDINIIRIKEDIGNILQELSILKKQNSILEQRIMELENGIIE
jgi:hypothetical protein